MALVLHRGDDTPASDDLGDIAAQIYSAIDRMALRVGELLERALQAHGLERWRQWVDEDLPFGLETARRLRAVYLAYREFPAEMLASMPHPWQALYALSKIPKPRLIEAIESGQVNASLSARAAIEVSKELRGVGTRHFTPLDVIAGRLLAASPDDLSPDVAQSLRRWLG